MNSTETSQSDKPKQNEEKSELDKTTKGKMECKTFFDFVMSPTSTNKTEKVEKIDNQPDISPTKIEEKKLDTYNICPICHKNRNESKINPGAIHVVFGPMFAGKTTFLKGILEECVKQNKLMKLDFPVLYVNSKLDTRDTKINCISSHDPLFTGLSSKIDQKQVDSLDELDINGYKIVGFDEYQLYKKNPNDWISHFANCLGIECWCVGLIGNARQKKFGDLLDLIPEADTVLNLSAQCLLCLEDYQNKFSETISLNDVNRFKAIFSIAKQTLDNTVKIGGSETYMAVCRKHRNMYGK